MSCKIDLVIKLGGSAITEKDKLETINSESLIWAGHLVNQCILSGRSCVLVHGAGSFGHHQAKAYHVSQGFKPHLSNLEEIEKVKFGFSVTRESVLKLNAIVVNYLLEEKISAVSLSPFLSWKTDNKKVIGHGCILIEESLENGFLPVLHGDCVFDVKLGCTILSGDTVIQTICGEFDVGKVVFITDVPGIFNKPPQCPDAQLLPHIYVKSDGDISADIVTSQAVNDVTGGIKFKLQTAINIVTKSPQTKVYVCEINSQSAKNICVSDAMEQISFIGTVVAACEKKPMI